MRRDVAQSIAASLRRLNSEFAHYAPPEHQLPRLCLHPAGDPGYFPPGAKHRYAVNTATTVVVLAGTDDYRADMIETWFARRTFSPDAFNIDHLATRKASAGLRTSVILPSKNEATTIEQVVKSAAALRGTLVDEIIVIDGSTDNTRAVAEAAGAITYDEQEVLPELGPALGKGDAMWRALSVTSGDLIVFLDTDIRNPDPGFIWSVLGPLLLDQEIQLVKGFFDRPIEMAGVLHPNGGGRVTELCARSLINTFWPELAGFVQPLSGEFAGRRELFESIPFCASYGVEIGMLIDAYTTRGIDALAQVDLGTKVHDNQPLEALARMAFEVTQAAMRRLGHGRYVTHTHADSLPERFIQFRRDIDRRLCMIEHAIGATERPPLRNLQ